MATNEALEIMYIEIDAKMDPFIKGVKEGIEVAGKEAGKTAQQVGIEFAEKFVEAFNKDLSAGLGPDLQDFLKKAVSRMKIEDLQFGDALAVEFQAVAKEGKVLNMTLVEIVDEYLRLEELLLKQVDEVMPAVIEKIREHTDITEKDREAIRKRLVDIRVGSQGTEEFRGKLEAFVQTEAKVEGASKKKTRAIRDQTESVRKDQNALSGLTKAASRLVKRFAVMFLGVHAVRQALSALKRTISESVAIYMESIDQNGALAQVMGNLEKTTTRTKIRIGQLAVPFVVLGKAVKAVGIELFAILLERLIPIGLTVIKTAIIMAATYRSFTGVIELAALAIKKVFVGAFIVLIEVSKRALAAIKPVTDFIGGPIGDAVDNATSALTDMQKSLADSSSSWKTQEEIIKGMQSHFVNAAEAIESLESAWKNLTDLAEDASLEKVIAARLRKAIEGILKAAELAGQKAQDALDARMDDITRRMTRRRADAQKDLLRDLQDIERDSYEDRVKATMDFQEKSFRLEEDFLMKMTELEENFIFEIEDAVRERDARGVLQAQRKFNLAKQQLNREKNLRTKRLKEDFKTELKEIEREREIRRMETLMEYDQQLLDFDEQEQRLRDDADLQFRRRMEQINDQINAKLRLLVEGFNNEIKLTNEELLAVYDQYLAAYGPDGYITAVYRNWLALLSSGAEAIGQTTQNLVSPFTGRSLQRGGSFIATSPTLMRVGEGVPERVDVTPLSRSTGAPRAGFGGGGLGAGGEGRVLVEINLGNGLVGEVIDEAMEEIAGVITTLSEGEGR